MKLTLLVLFVSSALADINQLGNLTLEEALRWADQHHPALAESRALQNAATARARQAGAFPNPEGVARAESARSTRDAELLAGVSQSIPLGGRLGTARKAELAERDRQDAGLQLHRLTVHQAVQRAFATALYQEKAFQIQDATVDALAHLERIAQARTTEGDALPDELEKARMELALARVERDRAAALRDRAILDLATAMGDPSLSIGSLAGDLAATFELPALEALARDLQDHPVHAQAEADLRAHRFRVDLAKSERIPDINVELLYRRIQSERRDAFDLGVRIAIPIFDRNKGRLEEARAALSAAEARSRLAENELAASLRQAHAAFAAALSTERTFRLEILPRAARLLELAETRHAAGDTSLLQLLPVRTNWSALQLTHLESLRDLLHAWSTLKSFARP